MRVARHAVVILICLGMGAGAFGQNGATAPDQSQPSLGDIARALRAKRQPTVEVTQKDASELFASINEILAFASQDSGLTKRTSVKYQLISREEADRHLNQAMVEGAHTQGLLRAGLVLKQFGLLPLDFDLKNTLLRRGASGLAGFYDEKTKTMNLLNWIALDLQRPVMAHELTHALQDQNYDLKTWTTAGVNLNQQPAMNVNESEAQEPTARVAVIEGQATLVYMDYILKPYGRSLGDSPDALDRVKNRALEAYDSPVAVHNAPLVLKETTIFPYVDGLAFEIELLKRGGRKLAFAGALSRPPRDTHEIMEPDAYLSRQRPAPVTIPDLTAALGKGYQAYDAGGIGELDVRIMAEQFGRENDPYFLAPKWDGGAYLAVKKPAAASKTEGELVPSDLALIYVSRWKSADAAQRFAELYKNALSKRSKILGESAMMPASCPGQQATCNPVWGAHLNTDQGPVAMELWPGNVLVILQGLETPVISRVRSAVLHPNPNDTRASLEPRELSLQLMQLPEVQALQRQMLLQLGASIHTTLAQSHAPGR